MALESGDTQFDGVNGVDDQGRLWVNGKLAKVITRKPRQTLMGTLSSKYLRKVTGDNRENAGVGGSVNADHNGDMESRPVERNIINKQGD